MSTIFIPQGTIIENEDEILIFENGVEIPIVENEDENTVHREDREANRVSKAPINLSMNGIIMSSWIR